MIRRLYRFSAACFMGAAALLLAACSSSDEQTVSDNSAAEANPAREVVVYTALDRQFSEPILKAFEEKTGITVMPVYDTEAVKTVGLVNRLIAEKDRPVCDVFWNNEIVRSIQLKREGLTQAYESPSAADIPTELKDPEHHWTGFAARARVILVNKNLIPEESDYPTHVQDLIAPNWKQQGGFAKPLFGTTSTHAAILWARWGETNTMAFWNAALENAVMYAGNAQARDAVADGEIPWCVTDTDDAFGAVEDGKPVKIIYPDSKPEDDGLILIPNTLVLIANAPHTDEGKALIDYLLSPEVEAELARSRSAQIPVRAGIEPPAGLDSIEGNKLMAIDWEAVADALLPCQTALKGLIND